MSSDTSSWILVAACIASAWWVRSPVPVAVPILVAHEVATPASCEAELRQLLELRDHVEWYRLLVLALCVGLAGLLLLLGIVTACVCGCCARCLGHGPAAAPRAAAAPRLADASLLALLAAQEVRR